MVINERRRVAHPWLMLALGVIAQASTTVFVSTPAFLIPLLHTERGLTLFEAGVLASAPTLGMVLTLIAWGALSDRVGERWVIVAGLGLTALCGLGAMFASGYVGLGFFFLLGGMAAASPNAASGRVVVGWFPKQRRGLAMGIRQMSQPLGVAVAAVTVPVIAAGAGIPAALLIPVALTAVSAVACAIWIVDPPRTPAPSVVRSDGREVNPNPYRDHSLLWRIHAVSILLVVPQFTVSTFGLVWLIVVWGYQPVAAGVVIGISQLVGAFGRIGVGVLSDRVNSRLRPLRWVAVSAIVVMLLLASTVWAGAVWAPVFLIVAAVVTVADNGLAYTSVAEIAGSAWSGRALGAQNTGQFIAASVVGPAVGGLITLLGFPLAFAAVALCPLAALPLIPHDRELERLHA